MKETNEAGTLLGAGVNAGYASMEDGEINFKDVSHVFDPLMKGQAGVQGVGEIGAELALATPESKDAGTATFARELKDVPAEDAYDIEKMYAGLQSAVSLATRKTRKKTADQIAAALQNGPQAASGKPLTGDNLLALIED